MRAASNLSETQLATLTFATFQAERALTVYQALRAFALAPSGWLMLTAKPGRGKTHLLVATANELQARGRYPLYVVVPDFLAYLRSGMEANAVETRIQQAISADVLLLDDLGAEYDTAWAEEQVYRVIDGRYRTRRATVIASNLLPRQMSERVDSRLSDRGLVMQLVLTCGDYRRDGMRVGGLVDGEAAHDN